MVRSRDRTTPPTNHYVNTERDYERDHQATLPQGRTAADGCKPRHGRDDRKRERSSSGLSSFPVYRCSRVGILLMEEPENSIVILDPETRKKIIYFDPKRLVYY